MGILNIVKQTFMKGYATSDIRANTIIICILTTAVIAAYIYIVYRVLNRRSFYNRNFNMSLVGIAVITAAVILTVQSNIVVSLGMVGALSIVRFRTAIKDPMDLVFLFWSIGAGIICGAGFALIAVVASIAMTIIIACFALIPRAKDFLVLVVNLSSYEKEEEAMQIIKENCVYTKVRSRNVSKMGMSLAMEVVLKDNESLLTSLITKDYVSNASLVDSDGDVTV